jgi:predicted trehalose synthase
MKPVEFHCDAAAEAREAAAQYGSIWPELGVAFQAELHAALAGMSPVPPK